MNVFKIAWRSIQHRGFGSALTILSMALGVMMVVAVLSIHGVVSQSFKNNNSFGYNVLVGARGGGLQLTLNTVYYLSSPVENIPYEYYLAFCDADTRGSELKSSIAYNAFAHEDDARSLASLIAPACGGLGMTLADYVTQQGAHHQQAAMMGLDKPGLYRRYTHLAVPICMGDYYVDPETQAAFRVVGTKPDFLTELVLDVETEEKFKFEQGRCFEENNKEHGFFECVVGKTVAARCGLKIGDIIHPTHGDPNSSGAHIHETDFFVVGILEQTGTPHDRVLFVNMDGFYLMDGHVKPVEDERILKSENESSSSSEAIDPANVDPFADEEEEEADAPESGPEPSADASQDLDSGDADSGETDPESDPESEPEPEYVAIDTKSALPIEQREVTSILVRTSLNDPYDMLGMILPSQINEGDLETTLDWSPYRPVRSQKAAQAVNPIQQVTSLFQLFVDPIRWLLLALTCLICVVSAISILVGIYNSMSQRKHEIAVMRALGAGRVKVMNIMLCEAMLLALAGGMLGWVAGHALNAGVSPIVESRTGVQVGFFSFAPGVPISFFPGGDSLPGWIADLSISPELLLIPGLIVLAIIVGIYPAISAYKTDVSKSLGK